MTDLARAYTPESKPAEWRGLRERFPLLPLLRKGVASDGPAWLPLVLVFGAFGAVAYADHLVCRLLLEKKKKSEDGVAMGVIGIVEMRERVEEADKGNW